MDLLPIVKDLFIKLWVPLLLNNPLLCRCHLAFFVSVASWEAHPQNAEILAISVAMGNEVLSLTQVSPVFRQHLYKRWQANLLTGN